MISAEALAALRAACAKTSQTRVAAVLGYSAPLVNQVLQGKYGGSSENVETAIRTKLMRERRTCPAFGDIELGQCLELQGGLGQLSSPTVARLRQTCPTCPHFKHH